MYVHSEKKNHWYLPCLWFQHKQTAPVPKENSVPRPDNQWQEYSVSFLVSKCLEWFWCSPSTSIKISCPFIKVFVKYSRKKKSYSLYFCVWRLFQYWLIYTHVNNLYSFEKINKQVSEFCLQYDKVHGSILKIYWQTSWSHLFQWFDFHNLT